MSDLMRTDLKIRKGLAKAGVAQEGDEDLVPSPTAAIPPAPPGSTRFGKQFTPEEKKAQADKLTEVLRRRL